MLGLGRGPGRGADDGVSTLLFGGYGRGDSSYHSQSWMNDLWSVHYNSSEPDPARTIRWGFVSGSRITNSDGDYTSAIHTAGGQPRARGFSVGWRGAPRD